MLDLNQTAMTLQWQPDPMRLMTRVALGLALFALAFVFVLSAHAADDRSGAPANHAECTGMINAAPIAAPAQQPETTPDGAAVLAAHPSFTLVPRTVRVVLPAADPVASLPLYLLSLRLRL